MAAVVRVGVRPGSGPWGLQNDFEITKQGEKTKKEARKARPRRERTLRACSLALALPLPPSRTALGHREATAMIEAVIFDLDGTLVDSVDLHALAWQQALGNFGYQSPSRIPTSSRLRWSGWGQSQPNGWSSSAILPTTPRPRRRPACARSDSSAAASRKPISALLAALRSIATQPIFLPDTTRLPWPNAHRGAEGMIPIGNPAPVSIVRRAP